MKMEPTVVPGKSLFNAYGPGYVEINGQRYTQPSIVTPYCVLPWEVTEFDSLEAMHFTLLLEFAPEVVLLGTGKVLRFCHPKYYAALTNAHIGVELMDTQAACRTFNILLLEERKVVAAILLEG